MAITDELREYANIATDRDIYAGARLRKIADRIDERHERACAEAYGNGVESVPIALDESAWVKLPVDADGEVIHVGDWVTGSIGGKARVVAIAEESAYWWEPDGCHWCEGYLLRHYHAPTVEDVLDEFANAVLGCDNTEESVQRVIAEYAAKLRLAGDGE